MARFTSCDGHAKNCKRNGNAVMMKLALRVGNCSDSQRSLRERKFEMRELSADELMWVSGGTDTTTGEWGSSGFLCDGAGDYYYDGDGVLHLEIIGTSESECLAGILSDVASAYGEVNWTNVFAGIAVVGGSITAIALAPAAVPILSVAGVAALVTEAAGIGITVSGATGH